MLDKPRDYKCKGCRYFKEQYMVTDMNIDGIVKKVVLWFPLCRYYFREDCLDLHIAIEKCKNFKRK